MNKDSIDYFEFAKSWEYLDWKKTAPIIKEDHFYATEMVYEDKMSGIIPGAPIPEKMEELYKAADRIVQERKADIETLMPISHSGYQATVLGCCLITGIGAVNLWHEKAGNIQIDEIPRVFNEPRGIEFNDEYIIDHVGIGFESIAGKKLIDNIQKHINDAYKFVERYEDEDQKLLQWEELYKAFYFYGMAYEIGRLGLEEYYSEYYIG
mgnify:FL=1